MGFAALWVLLYHSIPYNLIFPFNIGYHGIDLFLLVSGLGLYYSQKKNKTNYWSFIKKRLLKIVPLYLIVVVIQDVLSGQPCKTTILDCCMVYYFVPFNLYSACADYWYIPAAIIYYMCFPLLYKIIDKSGFLGRSGGGKCS